MDGLTWFFIIFFGIAAIIPATWSIIGLIRGKPGSWPAVVGIGWAVVLLLVTFIGIGTNWGGCPVSGGTSEGSLTCFLKKGDDQPSCKPDLWKLECNSKPRPKCGEIAIPAGSFCPPGQIAVFPFCERIQRDSAVKQPWATWSDLSFVAAGLWLLWVFQYFGRPGALSESSGRETISISMTADNPMITIGWLSISYCFIVIFMGPPSQWYHASMKEWAGWFDTMSVVAWLTFNAVYVWYMLLRSMWGKGRGIARPITVLCFWAGWVTMFGLWAIKPGARLYTYIFSGVLWGIAEVIYVFMALRKDVSYRRTWWLFLINLGLLGTTMGIWAAFHDGLAKTGCVGVRQDFPGHALFHILASFSTILTFFSFASERKVSD